MYESLFLTSIEDVVLISAYVSIAFIVGFLQRYSSIFKYLFSILNIGAVYYFFFYEPEKLNLEIFIPLILFALIHWLLLWQVNKMKVEKPSLYWLAFLSPVLMMIFIKAQSIIVVVGVSYLAFRMALAAFELRENKQLFPNLIDYLGFLLFPVSFMAGPINPLSNHMSTLNNRQISLHNIKFGLLRILIGYIKFRFIATFVNQLSFTVFWDNGYQMDWVDFIVSSTAYYLYLYMNFSGYTDMMVGIASILGIKMKENFNHPLKARNIKDFWRRWHLSLTDFLKDAVFTPIMLQLTRFSKGRYLNSIAIVSITSLFMVMALWHGFELGYFIFYAFHALAFSLVHISELKWRKKSKISFNRYMNNQFSLWFGRIATFMFLGVTCAFLELRTYDKISQTLSDIGFNGFNLI